METKSVKNVFGIEGRSAAPVPADPPKAQLVELRRLIFSERGDDVVKKLVDIALNDEHPVQGAAMKLCIERLLPMSAFEDAKAQGRSAITINISGIGDDNLTIDAQSNVISE